MYTLNTIQIHTVDFSSPRHYLDLSILVQQWYIVARVRGYYTVPLQRHGCASRQRISNVRPPENARSLRATPVLGF